MTDERKDRKIDSFTTGFVRKCAGQLVGKFGFKEQDLGDIQQSLYLKLAKHLDSADPEDPKWKAFVAKTVRRRIATLIRDRKAEKRDHCRVCSIHLVIGIDDEGPVELAETISEQEGKTHRACSQRSQQELAELIADLADCIADLPDEKQREFLERLKYDSISQVARDMGIPRTTVNSWLTKIRCRFEDQGLKDYL